MIKNKVNGVMKRCGTLLQQHYDSIGYIPTEEMNPYRVSRVQFYNLLELQEVIDLRYRLEQAHKELLQAGTNKSKLLKYTRMHIIEADPQLHQPALKIAEQLLRRYENQVYAININLDDIEDEYEEFGGDTL